VRPLRRAHEASRSGHRRCQHPEAAPSPLVRGSFKSRPCLPPGEWERVDSLFELVTTSPGTGFVALLMDDGYRSLGTPGRQNQNFAERAATDIYVFYEPIMSVVVALDIDRKQVSIVADSNMWPSLGHRFNDIMNDGGHLLREDRLIDALVFCICSLGEWLGSPLRWSKDSRRSHSPGWSLPRIGKTRYAALKDCLSPMSNARPHSWCRSQRERARARRTASEGESPRPPTGRSSCSRRTQAAE
jgi:hypothetical protein